MAKKKTIEAPENVAPEIESTEAPIVEATETEEPVEPTPEEVKEPVAEETPAPVEAPKAPAADLSALPVQAVEYLKRHTEVDAIYIDKFGGMFPKDTPRVFVKGAILYQNPYFKQ